MIVESGSKVQNKIPNDPINIPYSEFSSLCHFIQDLENLYFTLFYSLCVCRMQLSSLQSTLGGGWAHM